MLDAVLRILKDSPHIMINDVSGEDDHIILTVDTGREYRTVRLDVTDLGTDKLDHEE